MRWNSWQQLDEDGAHLISEESFEEDYPKAWKYLCSYEQVLRRREAELTPDGKFKRDEAGEIIKAPFNDEQWYRFGRHQSLDKQEIEKLIVPRLVTSIFCSVDGGGRIYLDNVDVGGVSPAAGVDAYFVAGVLNGSVAGYVFRRISKPFRGEYRSANKQFIAPLPIPYATAEEKADIAERAKRLQSLHTKRRDVLENIARRLNTALVKRRPETFLFPDLVPAKARLADAPKTLDEEEQRSWAKARYKEALQARYAAIEERLRPGSALDAAFAQGELKFLADGVPVIERIFLNEADGAFIAAQWKVVASTFTVPEHKAGERLCNELRKLRDTDNPALREQVIAFQAELAQTETSIATEEATMNAVLYRLYALTKAEIALLENDRVA